MPFLGNRCVCTDGPFVDLTRENNSVRIQAASNPDFDALHSVHIYGAQTGDASEKLYKEWNPGEGVMNLDEVFPAPNSSGYLRAEVVTRNRNRALTSALFLN